MERWQTLIIFIGLSVMVGCGPGVPTVVVTVDAAGVTYAQLAVSTQLVQDGLAPTTEGPQIVSNRLDEFAVQLPDDYHGSVTLIVTGQDVNGCQVAQANPITLSIDNNQKYYRSIMMQPAMPTGCRLVVNISYGAGLIKSNNTDFTCTSTSGAGATCNGVFDLGQPVTLTAQPVTGMTGFIGWSGGGCSESGDCVINIGSGITQINAYFNQIQDCSTDGFCWQNPLPQGNELIRVWGNNGSDLWAIGYHGTILRYINSFWVNQTSNAVSGNTDLYGVWGSGPNDVWLIGSLGSIFRWNGNTLSSLPTSGIVPISTITGSIQTLTSIWGPPSTSTASDVWIGCAAGTLLHWDGQTFTSIAGVTNDSIFDIWGTASDDVWAVTASQDQVTGSVLHYDGTNWRTVYTASSPLIGVWGSSKSDVWFSGGVALLHWQGTEVTAVSVPPGSSFGRIWGTGPEDVWASGPNGIIYRITTSSVSAVPSGLAGTLDSLWGDQPDDYWGVGEGGGIVHWNGAYWLPSTVGGHFDLNAIGGFGVYDAWAVGDSGVMLHWIQGVWSLVGANGASIASVYSRSPSDVWFVGSGGSVGHWNGFGFDTWTNNISGTSDLLWGVWGTVTGDVWAVGGVADSINNGVVTAGHGTIVQFHWNGTQWVNLKISTEEYLLHAVWGSGPTDIWAVGGQMVSSKNAVYSSILHYDGTAWSTDTYQGSDALVSIWGSGPTDIWAVGGHSQNPASINSLLDSVILHFDGKIWKLVASASNANFRSVWESGANDVWVGGDAGILEHWDGKTWTRIDSGTTNNILAVWGTDKNHIWLAGESSAILYRGLGGGKLAMVPAVNYPIGATADQVVIGDFNGDGKLDLAVSDDGGNINMLPGDGSGGFGSAVRSATNHGPNLAMATGDLNRDGRLDLVLLNQDNSILVMFGDGRGNFGSGVTFSGQTPISVAIGDLNGDGNLDLAVVNQASANLTIFVGDGKGGFSPDTAITIGAEPSAVVTADFDGDGRLDLAVNGFTNGWSSVDVLMNSGAGKFAPAVSYINLSGGTSMATGDLTGDGRPDIVIGSSNGTITLLNDGTGTFGQPFSSSEIGFSILSMAIVDLDGDGNLDAATIGGVASIAVVLGDGSGNFGSPRFFSVGQQQASVAAADFDRDEKPDLAATNSLDQTVSVLINQSMASQ